MTSGKKDWPHAFFASGGNPPTAWLHVFHAFDGAFFFKKKTSPPFLMSRFLQNWNSHPSKLLSFLLMEADPGQLFWDALRIHPAVVPVDFGEKKSFQQILGGQRFYT